MTYTIKITLLHYPGNVQWTHNVPQHLSIVSFRTIAVSTSPSNSSRLIENRNDSQTQHNIPRFNSLQRKPKPLNEYCWNGAKNLLRDYCFKLSDQTKDIIWNVAAVKTLLLKLLLSTDKKLSWFPLNKCISCGSYYTVVFCW